MNAAALPDIDFPGHDKLVHALDQAVSAGDEHAVTSALRNTLCRMIRDRDVSLPTCVFDPIDDHYARREIYRSPELGYSVVAMTWGPGQGTPVHDHCGLWCVEGVWDGELEITQYELLDREGVELVLLLGQCVGHDSATMARLHAPVVCVVAKDRVLAHNTVAALYELEGESAR